MKEKTMSENENKDLNKEEAENQEATENVTAALENELLETKKKLAETSDKYLRVLAEYDNFRKRSIKERDGIYGDAYVDCVKNLLPVIDNVERVLTLEGDEKFMEGLKLIVAQAREALNKMGVKEIECKTFDPNLHNAVMHIDDEGYQENEIVEVFQKGYIYGDKVIRYAMVKVAN
jgi:molecular chaperone GrpE